MKQVKIALDEIQVSLMTVYLKHAEEVVGLKSSTIYNRCYHMRLFLEWLTKNGMHS